MVTGQSTPDNDADHLERLLDDALAASFPASDVPSVLAALDRRAPRLSPPAGPLNGLTGHPVPPDRPGGLALVQQRRALAATGPITTATIED